MLWAGLITGGEGLYIFGSAVLVGLGRSPFGLSKTLPGASNKDKIYRSLSKFLQRHLTKQDILKGSILGQWVILWLLSEPSLDKKIKFPLSV